MSIQLSCMQDINYYRTGYLYIAMYNIIEMATIIQKISQDALHACTHYRNSNTTHSDYATHNDNQEELEE